ncbi:MAG: PEP-CTERM sorting domain-containing protein [Armatimonadota bacterium]|jgi:hypothetical protein|nr:PEP-CTERM sorting domain-containing protein [Fimbriimonadaceae bacterium]
MQAKTLLTLAALSLVAASQAQYLLIPNSGRDQVWQVSAFDGSIISQNFIQDTTLTTPNHAIASGRGTIFVSDQILDSVREYDLNGNYLGDVAGAAQGLDNIRGIAVRNGELYVTVAGGALTNTIQKFNLTTNQQSTWATLPSGSSSPWALHFRANDVLVSESGGDDIIRYDFNGTFLNRFYDSPGTNDLNFPEQIAETTTGDIYVAGFSLPTALYKFNASGTKTGTFPINTGLRGVYELGNGKILWTAGTRFGTFDPATNQFTDIYSNPTTDSFRFISYVPAVPEPATMTAMGLGLLAMLRRRNRQRG